MVRLVPVLSISEEDPCRIIPDLTIKVDEDAIKPLDHEDWGNLI